ncbi:MAG TPA: metallophosphoesterase family protein, partial [Gemmatimonadaceae bacterium]
MSDTHDRVPAIAELLKRMTERGVGMVLHAGDFCSPFSLKPFQDTNVALAGVFGRNDGDPEGLKAFAEQGMG